MNWQGFVNQLTELFVNFSPVYIIETVLLAILFYCVLRVLKANESKSMMAIYIAAIVVIGTLSLLLKWGSAFFVLLFVLSAFMLLLFAQEIKRAILDKKNSHHSTTLSRWNKTQTEVCIESIIKALQNMSKGDIGALIVLSNGNLPKQILESGTQLNADISQSLIEGIFIPKAPLHDGAMIIDGNKIVAAGCFLPLTQNNEKYPKDLGTRHRAGIGVTEVTNVVSLIVSEETGIISIVKQGKVTRYADYNMLRAVLQEYYWTDFTARNGIKRRI